MTQLHLMKYMIVIQRMLYHSHIFHEVWLSHITYIFKNSQKKKKVESRNIILLYQTMSSQLLMASLTRQYTYCNNYYESNFCADNTSLVLH